MKKILMRAQQSPLDDFYVEEVLRLNHIRNMGDLLYTYSVYRTLMTEDSSVEVDYLMSERDASEEELARINQEYDGFVFPLFNLLHTKYVWRIRKLTDFIRRLTIPCYVIGVGFQSTYELDVKTKRSFDPEVIEFVKAVLDKSAKVGIRGEITGAYLKRLGFREEKDFTVIGCPSMYSFGTHLTQKPLELSAESSIAFNLSHTTPEKVSGFIFKAMEQYPNHYLVEQTRRELQLLYYGRRDEIAKEENAFLPACLEHPLLQENRYRVFINFMSWHRFMKQMDLSVGSRAWLYACCSAKKQS